MRGSCRDMNSDLFFAPERERGPSRAAREAQAEAVCRGYPVAQQCRDHAPAVHPPHGMWGGLSQVEHPAHLRADAAQTVVIDVDLPRERHPRSRGPTRGPRPAA